ncbi:MAG TPA: A24 family peptidase [Oculatellaceae cyanobacterium]
MATPISVEEVIAIAACLIASFTSLKEMKIPNWLTFPAAILAIVVNAVHNHFLESVGGWIAVALLGGLAATRKYIPFGVVKLLAAVSASLGPLLGIVDCVVFWVIYFVFGLMSVRGAENDDEREKIMKRQVPLGPMILIATILTIFAQQVNLTPLK